MNKIWAIARNLIIEVLRMRILMVFILVVTVCNTVFLALWLHAYSGRVDEKVQTFLSYSLSFTTTFLALLTIFISIATITRDIKRKEIFTVATKPIKRIHYLTGKFFGTAILNLVLLSVSAVMIFALAGLFWSHSRRPAFLTAVTVYLVVNLYILASWWSWWFGGCYGNRAFIDGYAVLALPLGVTLEKILSAKKTWRYGLTGLLLLLVTYNTFQIRQYRHGALHYWWMNREAYWENFLRSRPTGRYWELITFPDYDLARKGIYREILPDLKIEIPEEKVRERIRENVADTTLRKDLIPRYTDSIYTQQGPRYRRELILEFLVKKIRANPSLMRQYRKEAKKEDTPLDSLLLREADYLIHKYNYK